MHGYIVQHYNSSKESSVIPHYHSSNAKCPEKSGHNNNNDQMLYTILNALALHITYTSSHAPAN